MNKRALETGKTVLIVVLAALAVFLFVAVRYYSLGGAESGVPGLGIFGGRPGEEDAARDISQAARPVAAAVRTAEGRYAAVYGAPVSDIYSGCSAALREALGTVGEQQEADQARWRELLSGEGVYLAYDCPVELAALAAWLGVDFQYGGSAESLLLCPGAEDSVVLYVNDGNQVRGWATKARYSSLTLGEVRPNGGVFAFELPGTVYDAVEPEALIIEDMENYFPMLDVSTTISNSAVRASALEFLGVNPYADFTVFDDGGILYSDTNFRLEISPEGAVSLRVYVPGSLSLAAAPAYPDEAAGAVEAARALAAGTIGAHCGQAELMCTGCTETEEKYIVTFDYYVNGIRVTLPEGDAARITVEGGEITGAELVFRSYAVSESSSYVLSPIYAAAALPGSRMRLVYAGAGAAASANWQG